MPIQTNSMKNFLATQYAGRATHASLTTTVPGASAGTEVSGLARVAIVWGAAAGGSITGTASFTGIPAGTTIVGAQLHTAATGGSYEDGGAIPNVTYPAGGQAGKYDLTITETLT